MWPQKGKRFICLIILIIIFSWPYFLSGKQSNGTIRVYGEHDTLWHLSLISESANFWPLQSPGLAGMRLVNYHYLSDFTWGMISKFTGLSNLVVYFRIAPIISFGLLIIGVFALTEKLTTNKLSPYLAVLFTLCSGSAAYLIPFLTNSSPSWYPSSFGVDHFLDQSMNIHTILGYAVVVWGLFFLTKAFTKSSIKYQLASGICFGILFSLKSFFFIPVFVGLTLGLVIIAVKTKKYIFLPIVVSGSLAFVGWLVISSHSTMPLVFSPGWLSLKIIEEANRFRIETWLLRLQIYTEAHNYLRIAQIYFQATLICILGGFWLTLGGLAWILSKKHLVPKMQIVMTTICLFSITMPFLIVPTPDNFNTVQFFQPALLILSISLGIWLSYQRAYVTVLFVLGLFPTTAKTLLSENWYAGEENTLIISQAETEALAYLKNNTPRAAVVLAQSESATTLMKVPALAERRTWFTDEKSAQLIGGNYLPRLETQKWILENLSSQSLTENNISFVLLEKDQPTGTLQIVFENKDYVILSK